MQLMEKEEDNKEGLSLYELSFLILPSIPEDKLSGVVENINKLIVKNGGVEVGGEAPFKQLLAYSMSKTVGSSRYVVSDAYLGWIKFKSEPVKVLEIQKGLEKMEEILRFLIVKAPHDTNFTFAKARTVLEGEDGEVEVSGQVEEVDVR